MIQHPARCKSPPMHIKLYFVYFVLTCKVGLPIFQLPGNMGCRMGGTPAAPPPCTSSIVGYKQKVATCEADMLG